MSCASYVGLKEWETMHRERKDARAAHSRSGGIRGGTVTVSGNWGRVGALVPI